MAVIITITAEINSDRGIPGIQPRIQAEVADDSRPRVFTPYERFWCSPVWRLSGLQSPDEGNLRKLQNDGKRACRTGGPLIF